MKLKVQLTYKGRKYPFSAKGASDRLSHIIYDQTGIPSLQHYIENHETLLVPMDEIKRKYTHIRLFTDEFNIQFNQDSESYYINDKEYFRITIHPPEIKK